MMLLGLILLSIIAVLTFFGFSERFFRKIGISEWVAFLLVLALVIGAVVPTIRIGGRVSLSVGGFIIPVVLIAVILIVSPAKKDALRSAIAIIAVAGITIAVRMLIVANTNSMQLVTAAVLGLCAGIAAYLAGGSRAATLVGAFGGIILGDVAVNLVRFFVYGFDIALGGFGTFDAIVLAAVVGVALLEIVEAMKRTMNNKNIKRTLNLSETAEENSFTSRKKKKQDKEDEKLMNHFE
jgi:uncharacterized protein (DUF697 family)